MFAMLLNKKKFSWGQPVASLHKLTHSSHPGNHISIRIKRGKMLFRLCWNLKHHQKVKAIFHDDSLREIVAANPRIYEKIYREYLYCGAKLPERLQILQSNYHIVGKIFDSSVIRDIYVQRNFQLCTIPMSCGRERILARLAYWDRFEKEGELTLGLHNSGGKRLYSVSFSFQVRSGILTAVIGCIIGPDMGEEEDSLLTIKELTKGMHGIRPKNLVFLLFQSLCQNLGVRAIMAVGSGSHIYNGSSKKRERIKFDYDDFWKEVGGAPAEADRHFFTLPVHSVRRTFEEIRTNKRASYQRRYAFLDDLEAQIKSVTTGVGYHTKEVVAPETATGRLIKAA